MTGRSGIYVAGRGNSCYVVVNVPGQAYSRTGPWTQSEADELVRRMVDALEHGPPDDELPAVIAKAAPRKPSWIWFFILLAIGFAAGEVIKRVW